MKALCVLLMLPLLAYALPRMRTAPQECPLEQGNLIDTVLFVENSTDCEDFCSRKNHCLYYYFYEGSVDSGDFDANDQPSQCFLYDECRRKVIAAGGQCPLNRENTVNVRAFVRSGKECERSCSSDHECGYFKYFDSGDSRQPEMCYHLKSCSPRIIKNQQCPLEPNNYIDHFLFTQTNAECQEKCEDTADCRFYYWYPIDYSPAPLYCYLFRSCEGGADEPHVAIVAGGRHPGYYFLDHEESMDLIRSGAVCEHEIDSNTTEVGRAGAVAEFVGRRAVLCGGKDRQGQVRQDCVAYNPRNGKWSEHTTTRAAREEAASTRMQGAMYVFGGLVDKVRVSTSEMMEDAIGENELTWESGPELPEARSRFCAVTLPDGKTIAILGGETDAESATMDLKTYDSDNQDWSTQPEMRRKRKDHACLVVEINDQKGILVTGGVDETDALLRSVEFYSFESESWQPMADLSEGRTEHGMALVSGMASVIGGISEQEFLRSIEVLDNSADDDAPAGMDWRIAAHDLSRPRYDFAVAAIPISALPHDERRMDRCFDDADVIERFIK